MAHPRGVPGLALFLMLIGAACITYSFLPNAPVKFHAFGVSSASVALGSGAFFLFAGAVWVTSRLTYKEPARVAVAAHVSFSQKMHHELPPPELPPALAESRLAPLAPPPTAGIIEDIDVQIRELNKQVNRAAVLFATNQLSEDAYKRRVEALKKKRAELETRKVHTGLGFKMK
ncbi:MAG: hypothetical protein ACYDCK_15035 [Thermoplasmatota archaeon]